MHFGYLNCLVIETGRLYCYLTSIYGLTPLIVYHHAVLVSFTIMLFSPGTCCHGKVSSSILRESGLSMLSRGKRQMHRIGKFCSVFTHKLILNYSE